MWASLIQSAKVRGLINEFRGYEQAVYSFMAIKDRLPGDLNKTGKMGRDAVYTYSQGDFPAPYDGTDSEHGFPTDAFSALFIELYLEKILDFEPINTQLSSKNTSDMKVQKDNGAIPSSKTIKDLGVFYQYHNNPVMSGNYNQGINSKNILLL